MTGDPTVPYLTNAPSPQILVVDDDPGTARSLTLILRQQGYQVEMARDGLEAVVRVQGRSFDLVLLDIHMPRLDGLQACRQIEDLLPQTEVLMMTAYPLDETARQMLEGEGRWILSKPLDIPTLLELLATLLGRNGRRKGSPPPA